MADTYAEFVQMMREQGAANNGPSIELAVMTGPKSCKIGTLQLSGEDLYIPDRLMSPACTGVKVPALNKDASAYSSPLKAGDTVAVCRLSQTAYLILQRVVRAG